MKRIMICMAVLVFVIAYAGLSMADEPSKNFTDPTSGIEMVSVKGGCYQMGCGSWTSDCYDWEKPVHEVCVDDFYIGKYEVTQGQWKAIMGNNPSYFKDCGDNCPVENVSWNDIQDFIRKLNEKTKNNPQAPFVKGEFRLPTEAEWEYAAKNGGKNEKYSGTSNESEIGDYAWYGSNSGNKTHPVGQKKPNGLGLYDMSGNVWEWVADCMTEAITRTAQRIILPGLQAEKKRFFAAVPGSTIRGPWRRRTGTGRHQRTGATASDFVCCCLSSSYLLSSEILFSAIIFLSYPRKRASREETIKNGFPLTDCGNDIKKFLCLSK